MTANDIAVLAPFIAAILLAAAILVVDFIAARPARARRSLVTFIGLTLVGFVTVATRQIAAADPSGQATAFDGAYVVDDADDVPATCCSSRSSP